MCSFGAIRSKQPAIMLFAQHIGCNCHWGEHSTSYLLNRSSTFSGSLENSIKRYASLRRTGSLHSRGPKTLQSPCTHYLMFAHDASTLSMCKWYLRIDSVLSPANDSMLRDKVRLSQARPANPSTLQQRIKRENRLSHFMDVKDTTALVGKNLEPRGQNEDVLTAVSVAKPNNLVDSNNHQAEVSVMATTLKNNILAERKMSVEKSRMEDLVYQVATGLSPQFKTMKHLESLGVVEGLYRRKLEVVVYYLCKVSSFF